MSAALIQQRYACHCGAVATCALEIECHQATNPGHFMHVEGERPVAVAPIDVEELRNAFGSALGDVEEAREAYALKAWKPSTTREERDALQAAKERARKAVWSAFERALAARPTAAVRS